jgi:hypothetical protein
LGCNQEGDEIGLDWSGTRAYLAVLSRNWEKLRKEL